MRTCIVCDTEIDLEAARSTTGQPTHGADDVDPDALVDDNESDNDLADIRRRIEKLEEEKQLQSDLDYLAEDFDD